MKIYQSRSDKREYKALKLQNNLQCILISDKDTDKSAASMSVNVGHMDDPTDRAGLAHFLEHMLFLGTEKYPNCEEYRTYLSKHGGSSNAYTSALETNYYFNCSNQALEGALDRFSQFFIKPLFEAHYVEREVKAVDSEHQKNLLLDARREHQIVRSSAKGIYNRFGTGNLETLNHPTIRDDLIKFYKEKYSANQMSLAVYSHENIETLEKWITSLFSDIPNYDYQETQFVDMPFDKDNLGTFFKITPVADIDKIKFWWLIDYQTPHYKKSPCCYLTHLFGHEGENSLIALLINEGLILDGGSGYSSEMRLFSGFSLTLSLTKKGLAEYEKVCDIVFSYIKMLKEKGLKRWIYEEKKQISDLKFHNKEKEKAKDYVQDLSARAWCSEIEDILYYPYMMTEYDEGLIANVLNSLTSENMRVYLVSKSTEKDCDMTEAIYGGKFTYAKFTPEFENRFYYPEVRSLKSKKQLDLPIQNTYLPKNMEIFAKNVKEMSVLPTKFYCTEASEGWFKQDNSFFTPKATIKMRAYTNDCGIKLIPETDVHAYIWNKLFHNHIRELVYEAEMANIHAGFSIGHDIFMSALGFNDSMPNFVKDFMKKLIDFQPLEDEEQFNLILTNYKRLLQNFFKNPPYHQAPSYQTLILQTNTFSPECKVNSVENVNFSTFKNFCEHWMKNLRFEWLICGNITEDQAKDIIVEAETILKDGLNFKVIKKDQVHETRVVQLPKEHTWAWEKDMLENETNSCCTSLFQQSEVASYKDKAILRIIQNIAKDPIFTRLRTEEQLGYIVFTALEYNRGVGSIEIQVQSNNKSPMFIKQRIDNAIKELKKLFDELKDEEFLEHKHSVLNSVMEKDLNIFYEANRYWNELHKHSDDFDYKEKLKYEIENCTKEEVIAEFHSIFFQNQRRLDTYLISPKHKEEHEKIKEDFLKEHKEYKFTRSLDILKKNLVLHPDYFSSRWI